MKSVISLEDQIKYISLKKLASRFQSYKNDKDEPICWLLRGGTLGGT